MTRLKMALSNTARFICVACGQRALLQSEMTARIGKNIKLLRLCNAKNNRDSS